ncbi:MAG: AraC family transcriptional regulator [Deltaproteobacteria bacterium]|nr:AraC family transcriptional regulator [Deltaproteobacteria bacterium]
MKSTPAIRELPFQHNEKPGLGFEIFTLHDLYDRAERLGYDLVTPQRPDFHTIYLGTRGRGTHVVDFSPVPLGAGFATIVARGRVQQFVLERRPDAWLLLIEPAFLAGTPAVLSPSLAEPVVALGDAAPELLALADQLAVEQARPLDAQQPALLEALLSAVLLRLERLVHADAPPVPELARFFTILERDFARTRAVSHYAKQAGISPRRLGELLGAHTGKSTKQLIDDRVVLELKRLLAHTRLSVKELADRTGFDEPTNLVKFFRQRTGQTPLEFRAGNTFLPSRRRS